MFFLRTLKPFRPALFALLAVASVGLTACDSGKSAPSADAPAKSEQAKPATADKSAECDKLIDTVNAGTKKIEDMPSTDDGAKEAKESAKLYNQLAADIAKLSLTDPELQKAATEYQGLMKSAAQSMESLAALMKNPNEAKLAAAEKSIDQFTAKEEKLTERVEKYCNAP